MRSPCRPAVSRTFLNALTSSGAMLQIQGPNVAHVCPGVEQEYKSVGLLGVKARRDCVFRIPYCLKHLSGASVPAQQRWRRTFFLSRDGAIPGRIKGGPPKGRIKSQVIGVNQKWFPTAS